ncbi:MAG: Rne/Rng family ribonuclease [Armatimonadetes bacterium]|nr:Rne/Rng family ribonuclease [Armatimonadota bacterium]
MSKEIIVNCDTRETRVALLESGKLVELHIERDERVVGSIFKCKVCNVLPGMDAAFVDIGLERNAFLYVADVIAEADEEFEGRRSNGRSLGIRDVLKVGQELMVQVVKGPRGTKGARVSTRISLPGRYCVLMPESDNLGVSRKIAEARERDRLKRIVEASKPSHFGVIVRTEAEGKTEQELRNDLEILLKLWSQVETQAKKTQAPGLVHQDLSLLYKTIRDVFGGDVNRMVIDSPDEYEKALELFDLLSPKLKNRVQRYTKSEPIFDHYGIETEIDRLLRRKVWLKSGGNLTIDETEALTTIDVNTGKFIGSTSLSETILRTNLDAATEIARQLRLRDIGGIIVIDFIDMTSSRDRTQVVNTLEKALRRDRTRTKISHISPLGIIEMTRKRTGETISEVVGEACPYCQGRGRVASALTISIEAERALRKATSESDAQAFVISVNPEVAYHLVGPRGETVEEIERRLGRKVYVRAREDLHTEKYEILPGTPSQIEKSYMTARLDSVVECSVVRNPYVTLPHSTAWLDGYMLDLTNGGRYVGQTVKAKLTDVRRSWASAEVLQPAK